MKPKLSVIICTYNRASSLKECLNSLAKQSFPYFEVIIVDRDSTDETGKVIKSFTSRLKIRVLSDPKKGLSVARDLGWRKAKGELVAWIDDDVVTDPNWAGEAVNIFKNRKEIGGVTGPTIIKRSLLKNRDIFFWHGQKEGAIGLLSKIWVNFFLEGKPYAVGIIYKSGAWAPGSNFEKCLDISGLQKVSYLEACNMILRRKLVEKVGGYDTEYKGTAEWCEVDLSRRVRELGYILVFSVKVKVQHNISQGGVYTNRTVAKERMENFFKFYFRHIFKLKPDYIFKFASYVLFLNTYWIYKAISTKNINWLGGLIGSVTGLKYVYKSIIRP